MFSIIADNRDIKSLIKGLSNQVANQNVANIEIQDCLECKTSALLESSVSDKGTYPVYGASGICGFIDDYSTSKESVLIIKDGSGVGTVFYATGKYSFVGTLNSLTAKDGFSILYLYYCLKQFGFEPYKTGMAIPHIYFKDYGKAKIYVPDYKQQLYYATILASIDEKISNEISLLEQFKKQKAFLLSKMFI